MKFFRSRLQLTHRVDPGKESNVVRFNIFRLSPSSAVAVGFVQLLASLLSGLLIDTVGRIPLLIISSVFMSLALASFGSYVHYDENNGAGGNSDWIPLLCVLIFTIAFSLGSLTTLMSGNNVVLMSFCS